MRIKVVQNFMLSRMVPDSELNSAGKWVFQAQTSIFNLKIFLSVRRHHFMLENEISKTYANRFLVKS